MTVVDPIALFGVLTVAAIALSIGCYTVGYFFGNRHAELRHTRFENSTRRY